MAKKIYLGSSDFAEIITNNGIFADKTLLIRDIIESAHKVTLLTRPRRWGKTLNQSMLQHFFASEVYGVKTAGLFDKLAIAKIDNGRYIRDYQGKSPVIFISFKDVKESTFDGCLNNLSLLIQRLYREHRYLLNSTKLIDLDMEVFHKYVKCTKDPQVIADAIKDLSELIYKHYDNQKVYILIDEYDTPLNEAFLKNYIHELTELMRNLMSAALKDNNCLQKGIMTGILRISKDSMLSGLNNLKVFTILDKQYREYFGFTDEELDMLFKEQDLERNEPEVKQWYDGYNFAGCHIYNPWSILSCLSEKGELDAYWVNTGSTTMIERVLDNFHYKVAPKITALMQKQEITQLIDRHVAFDTMLSKESTLWGLLLFSGHLTATVNHIDDENGLYNCNLRVPNRELMIIFNRHYAQWFETQLHENYAPFLNSLITGEINKFIDFLKLYLKETMSVRDTGRTPENFYHGLVVGLLASLRSTHVIQSNRESGTGFYDVSIMPRANVKFDLGLILEFKIAEDADNLNELAQTALEQIIDKQYDTELKMYPHIKNILKLGLAFNKKNVIVLPQN